MKKITLISASSEEPGGRVASLESMPLEAPSDEARIIRTLENDIELGLLHPRERLIEEQLAKRFNAGRHVIRAALRALEKSELLDIRPNYGAAVKFVAPEVARELYDVRLILERAAFSAIRFPVPDAALANLKKIQTLHEQAYRKSDLREVARCNIEFHNRIYLLSGNVELARTISDVMKKTCGIRAIAFRRPDWRSVIIKEHRELIDCLEQEDLARLRKVHKRHTNRGLKAYLSVHPVSDSSGADDAPRSRDAMA